MLNHLRVEGEGKRAWRPGNSRRQWQLPEAVRRMVDMPSAFQRRLGRDQRSPFGESFVNIGLVCFQVVSIENLWRLPLRLPTVLLDLFGFVIIILTKVFEVF